MMKSLSNIELVSAVNSLDAFISKDKAVPVKLSYAISKNLKNFYKLLEPYHEERQKILSKNDKNANDKLKELLQIKVDVDVFTVSADMIENIENLTTKDYMALELMIED